MQLKINNHVKFNIFLSTFARTLVTFPLLFMADIKLMIIFVIIVIFILTICYLFKKNR